MLHSGDKFGVSKAPAETQISLGMSFKANVSLVPQLMQKLRSKKPDDAYHRIFDSPCFTWSPVFSTRQYVENAVPCCLRHTEQWQLATENKRDVTSKRICPHRQPPSITLFGTGVAIIKKTQPCPPACLARRIFWMIKTCYDDSIPSNRKRDRF